MFPECVEVAVLEPPARAGNAVAAATAFLVLAVARLWYGAKAEGGGCCYRTPRYLWHSHSHDSELHRVTANLDRRGDILCEKV